MTTKLLRFSLALFLLIVSSPARGQERIDHLLQAAEHLEQAGAMELAAQARELAAAELGDEKQKLLQKKLAELQSLESEIAQLQQIVGTMPQVMIHVKVCQLDQERMQGGLGPVSLLGLLNDKQATSMVDEDGKLTEFIDFLRLQRMLKVLAEPSLVTQAGRTATMVAGGQQANTTSGQGPDNLAEHCGLRLACTPTFGSNGNIQIDMDLTLNNGPRANPMEAAGSRGAVNVKTKLDVPAGKTVFLSSPGQKTAENDASGVYILLTAELVQAGALPAAIE